MKKTKKRILTSMNFILAGLAAILGFSSCSSSISPDEYGTPSADFVIKGKVVNESNEALSNIRMVSKFGGYGYNVQGNISDADTLYTDKDGTFTYKGDAFKRQLAVPLVAEDAKGIYSSDSLTVNLKDAKFTGGHGWYEGSVTVNRTIVLKKTSKSNN